MACQTNVGVIRQTDYGDVPDYQYAEEALILAQTTGAVVFPVPYPDTAYVLQLTVQNIVDVGPLVLTPIITAKSETGFSFTLSAATDSANYVLEWLAIR